MTPCVSVRKANIFGNILYIYILLNISPAIRGVNIISVYDFKLT